MHRGHGGDAQIQLTAFDAGFDTTILWQAPLGNVQVGHQFDARIDRSAMLGRHHFRRVDDAVDPVAHMQSVVKRLEVDVRGAQVGHSANNLIDHADHGRHTGQVFQVFNKIA